MSLPWEQENIAPNLATLARLRRGDHLSVLKEGENTEGDTFVHGNRGLRARFKIEGKARQAFVRSKKGESILEDEQYLRPLIRFFRAAVDAWGRHQVTGDQVSGGFRGLENLRQTYANDTTRRAKMDQIIEAVRREMRGIRVEGVFLEPGERQVVLGSQNFPGMRQRILEIITAATDNALLLEEYKTGVTKEFLDAVYGNDAKPQKATNVPIGNFSYVRKHMGVCGQFHKDGHARTGVRLRGARITCSKEDLAQLFQFTNRDEGLLFATSQAANQGSVGAVPALLLTKGGRDGQREVPLIQIGADRVFPNMGAGHCNITKNGNQIVVTIDLQYDGNVLGFGTGPEGPKPLAEFGITQIGIRISVRLGHAGDRIELELIESTLRITTN